jgi:toxin ParE1/3/4
MSRFVIRPRAARDLDAIEEYVSDPKRGGPERGRKLIDAFTATFRLLAKMPRMGRAWNSPSPHLQGVRVWVVTDYPNYLVFYRPMKDGVEVLHVLHRAQDVASLLELPDDE